MNYEDKIYGNFHLDQVLKDLIQTSTFQRLKNIHQGGAIVLLNPQINHTRYEHSIGVMLLIRQLGGNEQAQIAGLLHDIPHTAFSHLIDHVLEIEEEDYHEKRYEEVLNDSELKDVLKQHGYDTKQFLELEDYPVLEYPLPSLSADRIDYTLRDLFQLGKISQQEIGDFLAALAIHNQRIVLTSEEQARWFSRQYSYLTSEYFGGKENVAANLIMKKIVRDCLDQRIIAEEDFFQDDFFLIAKINEAFDLKERITTLRAEGFEGETLKRKRRVLDPEVLVGEQLLKLSEIA